MLTKQAIYEQVCLPLEKQDSSFLMFAVFLTEIDMDNVLHYLYFYLPCQLSR